MSVSLVCSLVYSFFGGYGFFQIWSLTLKKGDNGEIRLALSPLCLLGLAFAILIWTLHVQQEELALQREELRGQKEQLQKQNFESSFFQLLGQHNENVKSMVIRRGQEGEYCGRECFGYMFKKFQDNYDRYKGAEEQFWTKWQSDDDARQLMLDWINDRYEQFFAEYEPTCWVITFGICIMLSNLFNKVIS